MEIKDSGNRREFSTGAVRDIAEGKGRCDLLPLETIANYIDERVPSDCGNVKFVGMVLRSLSKYIYSGDVKEIYRSITAFLDAVGWSTIDGLLEVSKHYEEGAKKYEERNWERGIPTHCYMDSGIRHFLKWYGKWNDEPHDRAFLWNMFGLLWTVENKPEINDLPYVKEASHDDTT